MDTIHCDFCDRPMDPTEHEWDRFCRDDDCHTTGVLTVADSRGHDWRVEYNLQGGERGDQSPMMMFVKLFVDGNQYGYSEFGSNLYVSCGYLKTTTTSEFETLTGLLSGKDEWDFDADDEAAMSRYSEDARALRDSIEQVEVALTEFTQRTLSDLGYASLWDELVEGQRRHDERYIRKEKESLRYRLAEAMMVSELDAEQRVAVLREMAADIEKE